MAAVAAVDREQEPKILDDALAATESKALTPEHAFDYAKLGPLFLEIFGTLVPGSNPRLKEQGTAVILDPPQMEGHSVSLGLTSTMDRLDPYDMEDTRDTILEKIVAMSLIFEEKLNAGGLQNAGLKPSDRDRLVPLVMSREMFDAIEKQTGGRRSDGSTSMVGWKVLDGVMAMASIDRGTTFEHVFSDSIQDLGLDREGVRLIALRNLKRVLASAETQIDYADDIVEIVGLNGHASSLILLDDFLERQRARLGGDIVIHLVDRERIVFFLKSNMSVMLQVHLALMTGLVGNLVEGVLFEFDGKLRKYWPEGMPLPN